MCIGVHDIVSFVGQSANADKSQHLMLVPEANIWRAIISGKWVANISLVTLNPKSCEITSIVKAICTHMRFKAQINLRGSQ